MSFGQLSCHVPRYALQSAVAVTGFKHKGLERFFCRGTKARIQTQHASRLRLTLASLSVAEQPGEMGLPGYNLHPLKGDRRGTWAVRVSGNWRVTFRFEGPDAMDVDYEDYH